jgi:hypothetical protein
MCPRTATRGAGRNALLVDICLFWLCDGSLSTVDEGGGLSQPCRLRICARRENLRKSAGMIICLMDERSSKTGRLERNALLDVGV